MTEWNKVLSSVKKDGLWSQKVISVFYEFLEWNYFDFEIILWKKLAEALKFVKFWPSRVVGLRDSN